MDVHQVVDDLTLNVILDTVDKKAATYIYHFDEGNLPVEVDGLSDLSEGL